MQSLVRVAAGVVIVITPAMAHAQWTSSAQSGWGWEAGYGPATISCGGCFVSRSGSTAGYLQVGKQITDRVKLNVRFVAGSYADSGTTFLLKDLLFIARIYPAPARGFFVELGGGGRSLDLSGRTDYPATSGGGYILWSYSTTNPVAYAGIGYDDNVGRHLSVTPFVNYSSTLAGRSSDPTTKQFPTSDSSSLLHFGLSLAWH